MKFEGKLIHSVEGGYAILFEREYGYAEIEFLDDGDIGTVIVRQGKEPEVYDGAALKEIELFLSE